jgi:hypothetical protein
MAGTSVLRAGRISMSLAAVGVESIGMEDEKY